MRKLSVIIAGRHATSICLEEEFIVELKKIAAAQSKSINQLVTEIDAAREGNNLSSAIRVFILRDVLERTNTVTLGLKTENPRVI